MPVLWQAPTLNLPALAQTLSEKYGFAHVRLTLAPRGFIAETYYFYLYKRYFEDLIGYVDKVLSPEVSDAEKAHHLNELYKTCDGWLRPLMEADRTTAVR